MLFKLSAIVKLMMLRHPIMFTCNSVLFYMSDDEIKNAISVNSLSQFAHRTLIRSDFLTNHTRSALVVVIPQLSNIFPTPFSFSHAFTIN